MLFYTSWEFVDLTDKVIGEQYRIRIPVSLENIGVDIEVWLAKENADSGSTIFLQNLIEDCEKYLEKYTVSVTANWRVVDLLPATFASIMSKMVFQAMSRPSWDNLPIKVSITEINDIVKEYERKNKIAVKEFKSMKKHINKTPEKNEQNDVISLLKDIQKTLKSTVNQGTTVRNWATNNNSNDDVGKTKPQIADSSIKSPKSNNKVNLSELFGL